MSGASSSGGTNHTGIYGPILDRLYPKQEIQGAVAGSGPYSYTVQNGTSYAPYQGASAPTPMDNLSGIAALSDPAFWGITPQAENPAQPYTQQMVNWGTPAQPQTQTQQPVTPAQLFGGNK